MPSRVGVSEPNQEQPDTSRGPGLGGPQHISAGPAGAGGGSKEHAQGTPSPSPGRYPESGPGGTLLPILDCGTRLHFFHANLFIPIVANQS